jgi:multidrug resistance efflux pump
VHAAKLDQANQDYERSARLYEQNLASKAEYDKLWKGRRAYSQKIAESTFVKKVRFSPK